MKRAIDVTGPATRDIVALSLTTLEQFGPAALDRYLVLIDSALRDLSEDAERAGVVHGPLAHDARLYHLRHSKGRVFSDKVARPRHLLVFKVEGERVRVMRVLHDAMDLPARLTDDA